MSVWTTKSLDRSREYIVLKHTIPGINYVVKGIKFRGGYAVIEKDSKIYNELKKIPVLKKSVEYPITHLQKLPFITRSLDIQTVYGRDVFLKYSEELEKLSRVLRAQEEEEKAVEHLSNPLLCKCESGPDGKDKFCNKEALEASPSEYCIFHVLRDPKLSELGIEVPRFMTKQERKEFRVEVIDLLTKMKKEGKF
jgi:hypothetical protein